jgi:CRP/FNR family transcriptional regulator, cyclic AMP receptor protein
MMRNSDMDLLTGLSPEEASEVMGLGRPLSLAAGEVLFRLGQPADEIYLVARGRIALTLPILIQDREEDFLVEERTTGETMGWSGLIPPHKFTLKASAAVPSELLAFHRPGLLEHFAARPTVGYAVTRNVAAVMGHRLQVFQTMWLREMQRAVESRYA